MEIDTGDAGPQLARQLLTLKRRVRPDQITAHYSSGGQRQLRLRLLPIEGGFKPLVLIEGTSEDLLFLADLLLAQAEDQLDCGFQLTAGESCFFSSDTEAGLYIHVLPCAHEGDGPTAEAVDSRD